MWAKVEAEMDDWLAYEDMCVCVCLRMFMCVLPAVWNTRLKSRHVMKGRALQNTTLFSMFVGAHTLTSAHTWEGAVCLISQAQPGCMDLGVVLGCRVKRVLIGPMPVHEIVTGWSLKTALYHIKVAQYIRLKCLFIIIMYKYVLFTNFDVFSLKICSFQCSSQQHVFMHFFKQEAGCGHFCSPLKLTLCHGITCQDRAKPRKGLTLSVQSSHVASNHGQTQCQVKSIKCVEVRDEVLKQQFQRHRDTPLSIPIHWFWNRWII